MLLVGGARGGKCYAVTLENEPVDKIVNWLAHECVCRVLRAEKLIAINFQTAGGGGPIGGVRFIEAFERAARWIKLIRVSLANGINARLGRRHVRIAAQIMFGDRKMPDQR